MAERYRVTVEAAGAGPPAIIRLRRFLKTLLRIAGLRAVAVEDLGAGQDAVSAAASQPLPGRAPEQPGGPKLTLPAERS